MGGVVSESKSQVAADRYPRLGSGYCSTETVNCRCAILGVKCHSHKPARLVEPAHHDPHQEEPVV